MDETEPPNPKRDYYREYYKKKKDEINAQKQGYRKQTKLEVVGLLGNKCNRCGYSNPEGLNVVNAEPRGEQGYATYYNSLYRKIKNGDTQMKLLCNNCKADV